MMLKPKVIPAAAYSPAAIEARIRLIAVERGIGDAELENVLASDFAEAGETVLQFVEKHDLSCDWLFCGDLRGLHRMRRPSSTWDYW
jgi:hypothetical protein